MKHILVVDDSKTTRQVVNFSLSDAGFNVTEAVDGMDALHHVETMPFDLIITDLKMPRMDGLELTRSIRNSATNRNTPVIILTTECSDEKKAEGKQAGANCWIVKPFEPGQLIRVVNVTLDDV